MSERGSYDCPTCRPRKVVKDVVKMSPKLPRLNPSNPPLSVWPKCHSGAASPIMRCIGPLIS